MLRSSYFEVKDLDAFVKDLEDYVCIVISGKGIYVATDEGDDSWPEYCTQAESTPNDVSLEHMIFLHIAEDSICLLPCGEAGAQAQSTYIAVTSENIYEIQCPHNFPHPISSAA